MDPDETAVEAEAAPVTVNGGEMLINMEAMIKNLITAIDKLADESKKHKEMLDDIFENSPVFREHRDKSKEASKTLATTKAEILKQPQAADLNDKIKNLKSELRENKDSLSDYLQEYARMAGVNEIEDDSGQVREIKYDARLVKKGNGYPQG